MDIADRLVTEPNIRPGNGFSRQMEVIRDVTTSLRRPSALLTIVTIVTAEWYWTSHVLALNPSSVQTMLGSLVGVQTTLLGVTLAISALLASETAAHTERLRTARERWNERLKTSDHGTLDAIARVYEDAWKRHGRLPRTMTSALVNNLDNETLRLFVTSALTEGVRSHSEKSDSKYFHELHDPTFHLRGFAALLLSDHVRDQTHQSVRTLVEAFRLLDGEFSVVSLSNKVANYRLANRRGIPIFSALLLWNIASALGAIAFGTTSPIGYWLTLASTLPFILIVAFCSFYVDRLGRQVA